MKIKFYLSCFTIFLVISSRSFCAPTSYPGAVPLDNSRPPATDLIGENGRLLPLYEAQQLRLKGFDISTLNPKESNIWKDKGFSENSNHYLPIHINSDDVVKNASIAKSPTGTMRFNGTMEGNNKIYTFRMSKRIHNVLLRSTFLKKLGYSIPPIKYIKKIRVKFPTVKAKKAFIKIMASTLLTNDENVKKRWIAEDKEGGVEVVLQDLIATSMNHHTYNLADGFLNGHSHIKGQRALNALLVPYHLTYVPESINLFPWRCGKVVSGNIVFDYFYAEQFSTPIEDVKWILNRIFKLTRQDYEEIVAGAKYPKEVALLMVEKLIEKRNNCKEVLNIAAKELAIDPDVSYGEFLQGGKLLKKFWDGKGSWFAFGDPESPLSASEIFAFMRSKFTSNVISNLIMRFNKNYMPKTDLESKVYDQQYEKAVKRLVNYMKTRKVEKTNFGVWAIPRYGVNSILSRDIVAGSYMGTDNTIQLADSIGINLDAGAYLGTDGVPAPWTLSGGSKVFVNRVYSHLKPIKSMKKALKEPFENMLVPWLKRDFGATFDLLVPGNFPELKQIYYLDPIRDYVTHTANLAITHFHTHGYKIETPIIEKAQKEIYAILDKEQTKNSLTNPRNPAKQKKLKARLKNLVSIIKNMGDFAYYKNEIDNALNKALLYTGSRGLLSENTRAFRIRDNAISVIDKEIRKRQKVGLQASNPQNLPDLSSPIKKPFVKKMQETLANLNTTCQGCLNRGSEAALAENATLEELQEEEAQKKIAAFNETTSKIELITGDPNTIIQTEINRTMKEFKSSLEVGESIIITDSLGGEFSVNAGYSFSEVVKAMAQFRSQLLTISRLHIHRRDENTIQIYKDLGNLGSIKISLGIHAKIPIISVSMEAKKGNADVKFYQLKIGETNRKKNPEILPTVHALRSLFLDNSTEATEIVNVPYTLTHDFSAKNTDASLLWYQWRWKNDYDFVTITHPKSYGFFLMSKEPTQAQLPALAFTDNQLFSYKLVDQNVEKRPVDIGDITESNLKHLKFDKDEKAYLTREQCDLIELRGSHNCPKALNKYFFKTRIGKRSGKNYEKLVLDIINSIIKENSSEEVVLSSINNGDPGNSFWGESTVREVSYEAEVKELNRDSEGKGWGEPLHSFLNLTYRWKGFKLSRDKADEILEDINKKFGSQLYPRLALQTSKNLQLYNISLNLFVYDKGIDWMASLSRSEVKAIIERFMNVRDAAEDMITTGEFNDHYVVMDGITPHEHMFYENAYAEAKGKILSSFVERFMGYQKDYKKALRDRDLEDISEYTAEMFSLVEVSLPIEGIIAMVGGRDNLYINSKINGFREGDENGDRPYVSNTIGVFGDRYFMGPMYAMKSRLGMTDAEFFINWLLGRL
ncbi:MAG: hypothetical protein ISR65_10040 [Bacteriovoracaceae bacterium]|nr:hypothetical protein [Bacteriovoracaceae bacterium]